ncbi:hypothetical protein HK103_007059, partial [Boothiomyces macroporosus]
QTRTTRDYTQNHTKTILSGAKQAITHTQNLVLSHNSNFPESLLEQTLKEQALFTLENLFALTPQQETCNTTQTQMNVFSPTVNGFQTDNFAGLGSVSSSNLFDEFINQPTDLPSTYTFDDFLNETPSLPLEPVAMAPSASNMSAFNADFSSLDMARTLSHYSNDMMTPQAPLAAPQLPGLAAQVAMMTPQAQLMAMTPMFQPIAPALTPMTPFTALPDNKRKADDDAAAREEKKRRNTESARRSRARKLERVQELERRLAESERLCQEMAAQVEALKQEKQTWKQKQDAVKKAEQATA